MSARYDQAELTRPGHVPSLSTSRWGDPTGACSCGWRYPGLAMAGTVTAIRRHIEDVDRRAAQSSGGAR